MTKPFFPNPDFDTQNRAWLRSVPTRKYNPDQPRDERGRWSLTSEDAYDVEREVQAQREFLEQRLNDSYEEDIHAATIEYDRHIRYGRKALAEATDPEDRAAIAEDMLEARQDYEAELKEIEDLHNAFQHITMFHGTSEAALNSIMEKGLIPQGGPGADAYLEQYDTAVYNQWNIGGQNEGSVFVTTSLDAAEDFAEKAAHMTDSEPVILAARIPVEYWTGGGRLDTMSHPSLEAYRFDAPIEPEWLSLVQKQVGGATLYFVVLAGGGVKKYDPNQPRDEQGKWTTGGQSALPLSGGSGDKPPRSGELSLQELAAQDPWRRAWPDLDHQKAHMENPAYVEQEASEGLRHYAGTAYVAINSYLRGDPPENGKYDGWATAERVQGWVEDMDAHFQPAATSMLAYRGIRGDGAEGWDDLPVGAELDFPSYTSATTWPNMANRFAVQGLEDTEFGHRYVHGPLLRINIPQGTPVIVTNPGESEVILSRNLRVRVTDRLNVDGRWFYDLTVL